MLNKINLLHDFLQKAIFHLKLLFKHFEVKIFGHIDLQGLQGGEKKM